MTSPTQSTPSPKPKFQRRLKNFLIDPRYQIRYSLWLTVSGLVLIALNSYLFYHYISENYALLVELSPMTDEAKAQLYVELKEIILRLVIISSGFVALTGFLGILFSHRTAGPMFHFKRVFKEIHKGNVNARVRLRPTDDFRDVADEFNQMMDELAQKRLQK